MSELFDEMIKRAVQEEMAKPDRSMPQYDYAPDVDPSSSKQIDPALAALVGTLADSASTYTFLKRGTAGEDNAIVRPLQDHPAAMNLGGAGVGVLKYLAHKKLQGHDGILSKLAQTLDAGMSGGMQNAFAAGNFEHTFQHEPNAPRPQYHYTPGTVRGIQRIDYSSPSYRDKLAIELARRLAAEHGMKD